MECRDRPKLARLSSIENAELPPYWNGFISPCFSLMLACAAASRATAHRNQKRLLRVAETQVHVSLHLSHRRSHLLPQADGKLEAALEVVQARLRGFDEPGRHGQPDLGHLAEPSAFPPSSFLSFPLPSWKRYTYFFCVLASTGCCST